jgi:hypothetical protein
MRTIAQAQGEWARTTARGDADGFAFGVPARRPRSSARSAFTPAGEFLSGRASDLPPVWFAIARLGAFLGCLAIAVSVGMFVVVHVLVGALSGFLGGGS